MSERESQRRSSQHSEDVETESPEPQVTSDAADQDQESDVDAILDEIDEVLEANAAEFVQGFVQKGGQ